MADTNKDGLTPGQPVDFYTLMRVKAAQRSAKHADTEPAKRGRPKKDDRSDQSEVRNSSATAGAEEAEEG